MRIRTIKPEFWRSDDITVLSVEARLLFVGLWSYVDDNGVGVDSDKLIAADLFGNEDEPKKWRTLVSRALRELASRGRVTRYTVLGKQFMHITNWEKHQKIDRPSKPRYPGPDQAETPENIDSPLPLDEDSTSPRDSLDAGTAEQGKSLFNNHRSNSIEDRFDEFWAIYPRRVKKQPARDKWDVLMRQGVDPSLIIAGAKLFADAVRDKDPQYVAHPPTWLNGRRWEDEQPPPPDDNWYNQ